MEQNIKTKQNCMQFYPPMVVFKMISTTTKSKQILTLR